ncbi:MAG: HNH endonuclease [Promethearchaeia archaeon]
MIGYKTLPRWLKKKYKEAVGYKCENCKQPESKVGELEIHRIKRGSVGGKYTVCKLNHPENNVKILCSRCHKLFHSGELGTNRK